MGKEILIDQNLRPFVKDVVLDDDVVGKRVRFVGADGVHYDDTTSLMQAVLGFCCCGDPDENLLFVADGLRYIERWYSAYPLTLNDDGPFGNAVTAQFFYYWAGSKGYTEHGSSIPGWLTPEGEELLAALESMGDLKEESE